MRVAAQNTRIAAAVSCGAARRLTVRMEAGRFGENKKNMPENRKTEGRRGASRWSATAIKNGCQKKPLDRGGLLMEAATAHARGTPRRASAQPRQPQPLPRATPRRPSVDGSVCPRAPRYEPTT